MSKFNETFKKTHRNRDILYRFSKLRSVCRVKKGIELIKISSKNLIYCKLFYLILKLKATQHTRDYSQCFNITYIKNDCTFFSLINKNFYQMIKNMIMKNISAYFKEFSPLSCIKEFDSFSCSTGRKKKREMWNMFGINLFKWNFWQNSLFFVVIWNS
jgi:hypothetical protein